MPIANTEVFDCPQLGLVHLEQFLVWGLGLVAVFWAGGVAPVLYFDYLLALESTPTDIMLLLRQVLMIHEQEGVALLLVHAFVHHAVDCLSLQRLMLALSVKKAIDFSITSDPSISQRQCLVGCLVSVEQSEGT